MSYQSTYAGRPSENCYITLIIAVAHHYAPQEVSANVHEGFTARCQTWNHLALVSRQWSAWAVTITVKMGKLWHAWLKVEDSETVQATTADMQACWVYIWVEIRWQYLCHLSAAWKVQCDSLESRECCRRRWPSPAAGLLFPSSALSEQKKETIYGSLTEAHLCRESFY